MTVSKLLTATAVTVRQKLSRLTGMPRVNGNISAVMNMQNCVLPVMIS